MVTHMSAHGHSFMKSCQLPFVSCMNMNLSSPLLGFSINYSFYLWLLCACMWISCECACHSTHLEVQYTIAHMWTSDMPQHTCGGPTCHSIHVEVQEQLYGMWSLLPLLSESQELKSGHQAGTVSVLTSSAILLTWLFFLSTTYFVKT